MNVYSRQWGTPRNTFVLYKREWSLWWSSRELYGADAMHSIIQNERNKLKKALENKRHILSIFSLASLLTSCPPASLPTTFYHHLHLFLPPAVFSSIHYSTVSSHKPTGIPSHLQ